MPGLFGTLHPGDAPRAEAIGRRMREAMRHHDWYGDALHVDSACGLAWGKVTLLAHRSAVVPVVVAGRAVLLEGEIYDASLHRGRLESAGAVFAGDEAAELLAQGLALHGERFLQEIDGYFSAAIWESASRTLTLVNDRFGLKPLYYGLTGDGFVFASEIKSVLKDPGIGRTLSLKGTAQFFTFGHLLGVDTFFDSVRAVPPGSLVRYDSAARTVAVTQYWRMVPQPPLTDEADALNALDQSFAEAVERRTVGDRQLGLSLSGGLDARTILAAVPRTRQLKSISLGIRGSIDHRAASELARLAGAEHYCHFLQDDFLSQFPAHLETLVRLTDGHYLDQAVTVPTLPLYRKLGVEVVLRGHAGELLHMDKAYAFSIGRSGLDFHAVADLERWMWSHLSHYMVAGVGHDMFRVLLRDEAAALARESLHTALAESDGYEPISQRLWHLFIAQRLRRETGMSMQMFNSVVDIRLPYLDNDLVSTIMRIPPALKMGDRIQSFILRRRMPSFLTVLNANTGTQMGASPLVREMASLRLKVFSKLRVPGYQPYERLGLWLSRGLQPLVRALLLSERALDRGVFEPSVVRRIIDSHAARTQNHTFLLMAMLIFELGQRQLLEEDAGLPSLAHPHH